MRLFTIGDSVSQGFMSAAAARTDLTYSTLIARSMELELINEYRYPEWALDGMPLNLERVFRRLVERYGYDIRGAEWLTVLQNLNNVIDEVEDYYERGPGAADRPYQDLAPGGDGGGVEYFHNVAIQGFDVADSWLVTPAHCKLMIASAPGGRDSFLLPNASFYRTALKVLNPSLDSKYDDHSQLRWLEEHAANPNEGVENLILWLGANNALGTIVGLKVNPTPNDPKQRPHLLSHEEREGWTLWHPDDFKAEYTEFLDRVDKAMRQNTIPDWKVFIGTVPPVTIAPLAKGVGPTYSITRRNSTTGEKETSVYYEYYVYFLFDEGLVRRNDGLHLEMKEAIQIDDFIREYNSTIRELVKAKNADHRAERYHIVDIFQMFQDIALKRNAGQPRYDFPKYFDSIYPNVDTRYYHADPDGRLRRGGLSSLDGVHPSAIGHGLLAHEFLKVMKDAGVVDDVQLDWRAIFESDRLYSEPIIIMQELYEHTWLAENLLSLIRTFRRSRVPESDYAPVVAESESPVERVARPPNIPKTRSGDTITEAENYFEGAPSGHLAMWDSEGHSLVLDVYTTGSVAARGYFSRPQISSQPTISPTELLIDSDTMAAIERENPSQELSLPLDNLSEGLETKVGFREYPELVLSIDPPDAEIGDVVTGNIDMPETGERTHFLLRQFHLGDLTGRALAALRWCISSADGHTRDPLAAFNQICQKEAVSKCGALEKVDLLKVTRPFGKTVCEIRCAP